MAAVTCPVCRHRKAKRACPARERICSVCCGTKRLVEIDCPSDCAYLTGAHAPSWEGRDSDRKADLRRLAPHLEHLGEDETALVFYLLAGIAQISGRHREAADPLWRDAVKALAKTLETRESGLIYEHAAEGLGAQELLRELQALVQPPDTEGPIAADRPLLAALRAIHAGLETTIAEASSPSAFLDTARRLTGRLAHAETTPEAPEPRIIEP